jgi:hypothetical protein
MEKTDWTVADKDRNISVPDRLDKLLNRIGFQVRLITVSGLNEIECLARMVKGADEHSRKEAIKFALWIGDNMYARMAQDVWFYGGDEFTTEELYDKYLSATAVTPILNEGNGEINEQGKIVG